MAMLKYLNFFLLLLLFFACNTTEYLIDKEPFDQIIISDWEEPNIPDVIVLEKYKKGSNFTLATEKKTESDFEIYLDTLNHRLEFVPKFDWEGPLDGDLKLLLNNRLGFQITEAESIVDTLKRSFGIGKKLYVRYVITNMKVNNQMIENNAPAMYLSLKTAKLIGKEKAINQ